MGLLNGAHIVSITEEQVVNSMGHVQSRYLTLNLQSCVDVLIGMAAYMKVPRYLLHSKVSFQPAPPFVIKRIFRQLVLLVRTRLSQQLEIIAVVDLVAVAIESVLLDGGNVRTMRKHGVLDVE